MKEETKCKFCGKVLKKGEVHEFDGKVIARIVDFVEAHWNELLRLSKNPTLHQAKIGFFNSLISTKLIFH